LKDLIKTESSFKLEIIFIFMFSLSLFFIEVSFIEKLIMFFSLVLILIVEAINGAIERVVDLVTLEYHEMAKRAKDAGSSAVFISIFFAVIVWGSILIKNFF
jgi:diacylglycerol kinase (ATP)